MEENKEMKNGIISEEALDEIAGGLNVKKAALITVLIASGITIGGGILAYKKGWIGGKKDDNNTPPTPINKVDSVDPDNVNSTAENYRFKNDFDPWAKP